MVSKVSKLVAILLIAVVVAAGAGYWLFSPKPTSEIVNSTNEETSLEVSRRTTEQTLATSTMSTAVTSVSATTLWLNVTATKPVSYYISLLKSAGAQPYVELGWELQALPDATNATAIAKITYLALNATNPEVKEAFQLMIKGGTPSRADFTYTVPNYNTELQVLYWLACQNQLERDDTLALAIAMVNGFWVTTGDDQVRNLVMRDANDLLLFFRETNTLQVQRGYPPLEQYPIEALTCLAWTGNMSPNMGPHPIIWGMRYTGGLMKGYVSEGRKVDANGYRWNTVSVQTLREMRSIADKMKWVSPDVGKTVDNLEGYFYFENGKFTSKFEHWDWGHPDPGQETYIDVDGEQVLDYIILNVDFYFDHFMKTGKGIGTCNDEAAWIDAWCKSWGISTDLIWRGGPAPDGNSIKHWHIIYYEPDSDSWKACEYQLSLEINLSANAGTIPIYLTILRPPVRQDVYFKLPQEQGGPVFGLLGNNDRIFYIYQQRLTLLQIRDMFTKGVSTEVMKEWIFYQFPSAIQN
jgi:hypothetical protein